MIFSVLEKPSRMSSEESYGLRRGQGGVAIFWKKSMVGVSVIKTINHDRICGIRVECNGSVIILLSVYMPASGSRDSLTVTLDELEAALDSLEEGACPIICGDFNGNVGSEGGVRGYGVPTKAGKYVINFMRNQNLIAANLTSVAKGQVNTYYGHNGNSLIDYIMVPSSIQDKIVKCCTGRNEALNTSDHLPIEMTLCADIYPHSINVVSTASRVRWDKCSLDFLMSEYAIPIGENLYKMEGDINHPRVPNEIIDKSMESIIEVLKNAAENIPKSKFKCHLKPYWNDELRYLKRVKMSWFNKWKEEGRTLAADDPVRINMLNSKKLFCKCIRRVNRQYQDNLLAEAAQKAEINHDDFWRILKNIRGGLKTKVNTIRNKEGKVVCMIDELLEVWRTHFDEISTPKISKNFDELHFQHVTTQVKELCKRDDISKFLEIPISETEVRNAIKKLNNNKAPGYDGITAEHIKFAGESLVYTLCLIYNHCIKNEYIPHSLKRGIQIPLYKGKNACTLDCNNYRGITLLSTFNKLLEILIWDRISTWWFRDRIVSDLQGAGRKGQSCIHTALTLQETISKEREGNKKVFVAYYDVSKAFDSVWIDGLFYQLHELGLTGSLWRLLYQMYVDFRCCVRIGDKKSKWFRMDCGIHQGGYLSLVKYTAFINSLITSLKESNLCSTIYRVKVSPVGYADDMATCSTSKNKLDQAMTIVNEHGCKWRYSFNASKSAVLVFGESPAERRIASSARVFKLGSERVKEKLFYDHVGIKTCVRGDTYVRTEEKVAKARKCLNMSTAIGITKGGINISTCNVIYWSVVLPTLCFGCEIWFLKKRDIDILLAFQRYAARRIQRLHPRSLNVTSTVCLGWMNILNYVKTRKIIFIRSIVSMEDFMPLRHILVERVRAYSNETPNHTESPIVQILQFCEEFGVLDNVRNMCDGYLPSKADWKRLVWDKAWEQENKWWQEQMTNDPKLDIIRLVTPVPAYSVWWTLSDIDNKYMRRCELMVKLLCRASLLKNHDGRLKKAPFGSKMCILCEDAAYEDTLHMVSQCHFHQTDREKMLKEVENIVVLEGNEIFSVLLGKYIEEWSFHEMMPIWQISCTYISNMYRRVLKFHRDHNL